MGEVGSAPARRMWWISSAAALLAFGVGAWVLFLPLGLTASQHLPTCACQDQALQVWFLAADHYAAVHGHLSMFSDRLDYPAGVNLLDNTSMPLLGLIAGPLFSRIGPVGVFNLLMRTGFVLSAASAFFVLRRYVTSAFAAFVGAGLYAFGPFMSRQGGFHLFLVFAPIPPLLVLLVEHHLAGPQGRLRAGAAVGALAVAEYFISSETFASEAVVLALTVAALGAIRVAGRRPILTPLRRAAPAVAVAAAIVVACLAYPAWFAIDGPRHLLGPTQAVPGKGNGLLNTVLPVTHMLLGSLVFGVAGDYGANGDMGYLGFPLLAIVVVSVVRLRRVPIVRFAALLGGIAWILSLGPRLIIGNRVTSIPLPFALFDQLPLVNDIITARFSIFVDLAAAFILAVAVDHLLERASRRSPDRASVLRGSAVGVAVGLVGLVLVLPVSGYPTPSTTVAVDFLNGTATRYIPRNGVVLAYPYPQPPEAEAMIWQADAGLEFHLLGGYALRPATNPRSDKLPPLLSPAAPEELFMQSWPAALPRARRVSLGAAEAALPRLVRRYHVTTILVRPVGRHPGAVTRLCRRVYGPPVGRHGLLIWPDLHHPRRSLTAPAGHPVPGGRRLGSSTAPGRSTASLAVRL
jgi:hypothetical protein